MIWALMKQLSIAQCYATLTYWNTSYDEEEYLADHKSLISSLNTLLNKEHDDLSSLYWITNFTRIHIQKRILQVLLLFQQSNLLYIWLTFWLLSKREYNHTGTKSIHVVASIKCGYWNTARIFWIDLILVYNLKIVSVQ